MPPSSPRSPRRRLAAIGLGLALGAGSLTLASVAEAETVGRDAAAGATDAVDDRYPAPTDQPDRDRPDRELEVLRMHCKVVDGDSATRVHIGCRWRPATNEHVAGYQLWRIVDRGERELVARGGLDMAGARDVVSADAKVVRYAVIAVNEHGRRIGQSRVQRVVLRDDRPSDHPRLAARHRVR